MTITERERKIEEKVQGLINETEGKLTNREIYEVRKIMERRTPAAPHTTEMQLRMAYDIAADYINDKQIECGACGWFARRGEHYFVVEAEPACNEWLAGRSK